MLHSSMAAQSMQIADYSQALLSGFVAAFCLIRYYKTRKTTERTLKKPPKVGLVAMIDLFLFTFHFAMLILVNVGLQKVYIYRRTDLRRIIEGTWVSVLVMIDT